MHTGLGVDKTPELKAGTSGSGSTSKHGQKPTKDESHVETPLALSVEDKFIPTKQPGLVIPLDLSFDQGSDEPSMVNKAVSTMQPSSVFSLDLSHDQSSDDFYCLNMTLLMDCQPHQILSFITVPCQYSWIKPICR